MKKNVLTLLLFVWAALPLFAQEVITSFSTDIPEESIIVDHGENDAHWALSLSLGSSWLDADFHTKYATGLCSFPGGTAGFGLEYHFTPGWGAEIEYIYNHVFGGKMVLADDKHFYGLNKLDDGGSRYCQARLHNIEMHVMYDIATAWFPKNRQNLVSFYLIGGGGLGIYSGYGRKEDVGYGNLQTTPVYYPSATDKNKVTTTGVFSGGMMLEFNCTKSFALGMKAMYHYYVSDLVDNIERGNNNDGVVDVALNFRFKFNAIKKDHIINKYVTKYNYETLPAEALQHLRDTIVYDRRDTTVIIHRDTLVIRDVVFVQSEPTRTVVTDPSATSSIVNRQNTTSTEKVVRDTVVVRDTIRIPADPQMVYDTLMPVEHFYAYFANNKSDLSNQALVTIQQVAARMQNDSSLCIVIEGHADMTGTNEKNILLSQQRADNVRAELVKVYNISSNRIKAVGTGAITNVATSYGPNRRADLRLMNSEDFKNDATTAKTPSVSAPAPAKTQNQVVEEGAVSVVDTPEAPVAPVVKSSAQGNGKLMATVYLHEAQTLCRISLKYYGDIKYWPLLYKTNKARIKNPNVIKPGTRIDVPYLTEADKNTDWSEVAWEVLNQTTGKTAERK